MFRSNFGGVGGSVYLAPYLYIVGGKREGFKRNFVDLAYDVVAYLKGKEQSNFQLKRSQSRRGGGFH